MHFDKDYIFHIYNRSNQTIFFNRNNYQFFISKIRKHIKPFTEIIAYCLMPNHFHLLVKVNENGVEMVGEKHRYNTQVLSKQIGIMLSAYTQAINNVFSLKGSLFAHQTKAKQLNNLSKIINNPNQNYARNCFMYIHQNPKESGLVEKLEDWEFSSFRDYIGKRSDNLVNKEMGFEITGIDKENLYFLSNFAVEDLKEIW